ncbi:hypothetical protein GEV33_001496 [Tenebrio molitor]|uniref:Tc1-like transposase DDE domain-containing protein n=1 Tax=Tenebrio molitor TaxID=7067 RepID=A0A8J6HUX1_TENMO|nr:hypothetical protein GEV33_001496 [Tenebrio molitor]
MGEIIYFSILFPYMTGVTITSGSDVTGFDAVWVGRGMPRAPVPFFRLWWDATRPGGVANKQISQEADLYLQYVETGGCWYLVALEPFGDGVRDLGERSGWGLKKSVARTYGYSGRTWTLLIFLFRGGGGVERKAGWPGFPHNGKERAGTRGKSGMVGVLSQWEGTGRDKGEKLVLKVATNVWYGEGLENDMHNARWSVGKVLVAELLWSGEELISRLKQIWFMSVKDNARPHVARVVTRYFEEVQIQKLDWPARSPDCNPIEHVWDKLGRSIKARRNRPQTLNQLLEALNEEWEQMDHAVIQELILSMPRRMAAVIQAGGEEGYYQIQNLQHAEL